MLHIYGNAGQVPELTRLGWARLAMKHIPCHEYRNMKNTKIIYMSYNHSLYISANTYLHVAVCDSTIIINSHLMTTLTSQIQTVSHVGILNIIQTM